MGMKLLVLLLILPINIYLYSYCDVGIYNPSGINSAIYTGELNNMFTLSQPKIGQLFPLENEFNLIFRPFPFLDSGILRRENIFNQNISFYINNFPSVKLYQFNIFSQELYNENLLIHHGLFIKKEGIYEFGLFSVCNFSTLDKMGYKIILHNQLNLHYLTVINILETKENYSTPLYSLQVDSRKSKSSLTLFPQNMFSYFFINNLEETRDYFLKENCFGINVNYKVLFTTLDFEIRDKTNREYRTSLGFKINLDKLSLGSKFSLSFINWPIYKTDTNYSHKIVDNLALKLNYKTEYIEFFTHNYQASIEFNKNNWGVNFKYNQDLSAPGYPWELIGAITLN